MYAELKESNGRTFKKYFRKGTRPQQIAFKNAVLAATVGTLIKEQESVPLAGADVGAPHAAGEYSDAVLYFTKGTEEENYTFEQLTNAVSDGNGGVDITDPLMVAIEAAFIGPDGATGWNLARGVYVR
jgi:hypothetical protein